MKRLWWLLLLLPFIFLLGPRPTKPVFNKTMSVLKEDTSSGIKPGNHPLVVINTDNKRLKTPYCLLYLHGFSASPMEGDPVMQAVAEQFGMNLYAPRLFAHGLRNQEAMLEFNAEAYWQSAVHALMRAGELGDSVIIMGTSTGATLGLMLAAAYPEKVNALLLYSPNINLKDSRSFLLTAPWGLHIARWVKGGKYHTFSGPGGTQEFWNTRYRLEALVELKNMLNHSMLKSTFKQVKQPVLTLFYYKDEEHQDDVVSIKAIQEMFGQLGTSSTKKRMMALPDAESHALASKIWNKNTHRVVDETNRFLKEVMHF